MLPRVITLFRQRQNKSLAAQLVQSGVGTVLIRISNILITTILAVFLARTLKPDGYGTYAYAIAIAGVLAIPAQLGIPRLVIRETARALVNQEWGLIRGLWRWATKSIVASSLILLCFTSLITWIYRDHSSPAHTQTILVALALIPLAGLLAQCSAALGGLHRVTLGHFPELILRPGILLIFLLGTYFCTTIVVTPFLATVFHVLAVAFSLFIGWVALFYARPTQLICQPKPTYNYRKWLHGTWPLALTAGMQQINQNADLLMLGYFAPTEDVGIYRVATQIAMLIVFGQQALAMLAPPYYASLYAKKDMKRLQLVVTTASRLAFFTALPLILIFLIFGKPVINLIFGESYNAALSPLLILGCGQLVNASFGHVGILLNMTGHERDTTRGMIIAASGNITLNLLLIPPFGINGAAIATALSLIIWNVFLRRSVQVKLSIETFAFIKPIS